MSSFEDTISKIFGDAESFVQGLILKIQTAEQWADHELAAAITWLNGHIVEIAQYATEVASMIATAIGDAGALGIKLSPEAQKAVDELNVAVTGLNAAASSAQAGNNTAQFLVDGFVAAKQAQAAAANAQKALAANPNGSPAVPTTIPSAS